MSLLLVVALVVVAAALGASVAYGMRHRLHPQQAGADDAHLRGASRSSISASFAVSRSGPGRTAELGGIRVTVEGVDCGSRLSASIRQEWSKHESGEPCIVRLAGTTGTAPVNLSSDAQTLADADGRVYQVSSLQHVIACDKLFDHRLDVRTTVKDGCLLYTLDKGTQPTVLTLIHGPNSVVVTFTK